MVPAKGLVVHSFGLAATTSRWDRRRRLGFSPVPFNRVIRLPLPGADSRISEVKPSLVRYSFMYWAACVSFPGGLVVFIWIRLERKVVISSLMLVWIWMGICGACGLVGFLS